MNSPKAPLRWFLPGFLAIFGLLFTLTLKNYGPTWDSAAAEFYAGDRYFYFLTTLDRSYLDFSAPVAPGLAELYRRPDHPDLSQFAGYAAHRPHHIWSLGPLLSAAGKYILYTKLALLSAIDAQHAVLGVLALILFAVLFGFVRRFIGPWEAIAALLSLAAFPRLWADLHNNIKDVPATVFFSLTLLAFYHSVRQRSLWGIFGAAVLWGLTLAAKANGLSIALIVLLWLAADRVLRLNTVSRPLLYGIAAAPFIAFAVFLLAWPLMLVQFPHHLLAYVHYLRRGMSTGPDHWQLLPLLMTAWTMPLATLLLFVCGLWTVIRELGRRRANASLALLLLLWLAVPLFRVSLPGAESFDGIRHWLEIVPAIAVVAGVGAGALLNRLRAMAPASKLALLLLLFVPVLSWQFRSHPFEICFYNALIGGLSGAQARGLPQATDYWGSSYRRAVGWLNANAEQGAVVLTGVGQQIVAVMAKPWLRPDLRPQNIDTLALRLAHRGEAIAPESIYLLYITRSEAYPESVAFVDRHSRPIKEFTVDGAALLKIHRLRLPRIIPPEG